MKKDEAEKGIRHLCYKWGELRNVVPDPAVQPNFSDFMSWVRENYPAYLDFRSTMPVADVVESWFDQEFRQTWRN